MRLPLVATLGLIAGVIAGCSSAGSPSASVGSPSLLPSASVETTPSAPPASGTTPGPCDPGQLVAQIVRWEGAAGSRIAEVELTSQAPAACSVQALARPQLVDATGTILIDGTEPDALDALTIEPAAVLTAFVQASNYCGPTPAVPVTVQFLLADGERIVATPPSATDDTVPPCMGTPGSAGQIVMHAWAP